MKKKSMIIVAIVLLIILILFIFLILKDLQTYNKKTKVETNVIISDWSIEKKEYYYMLSYSIDSAKLSNGNYDVYILDKSDNLLYIINNVSFNSLDNGKFYINQVVEYDISNMNKIIVASPNSEVYYVKDLSDSIKYIGEITHNIKDATMHVTTKKVDPSLTGE